ncbi:LysR family transcriptional regulator [Novosphingobium sp.]|uniref:LysR family transcriptional regulator n=1 Tax=Novosphingobium sp. TaxID=1874826 RepID=UPI00333E9171
MATPLPPLVWLRTFEACARHLSFARAADELGLTPAAVGQHIKALESHLGFMLFERLPRGVRLSTIGRAYFPIVATMLDDLTIATAGLFGGQNVAAVTVRCSVSFATLCLAPALPRFTALHPAIPVKIYSSIWSDDLEDSQIDIDVRFGNGRWEGFTATALTRAASIPVCPPRTDFGADPARALFDLASGSSIQIVGLDNLWVGLSRQLGWPDGAVVSRFTVDTSAIALELAASGTGCAMVSADLARLHLQRGLVSAPPGIVLHHDLTHYVLLPARGTRPSPETLRFRDWLLETFTGP